MSSGFGQVQVKREDVKKPVKNESGYAKLDEATINYNPAEDATLRGITLKDFMSRRVLPRILATDVLKKYISATRMAMTTKGLEHDFASNRDNLSYAKKLKETTESIISDTW